MGKQVADGFVSLLGGMQGGIDPSQIAANMYARGINVSSREGLVRTRSGFSLLGACPVSGKFQGACRWALNSADRVVLAVSGRLLTYNLETGVWDDLGVQMSETADVVYLYQADRWVVVQDGTSPAKAIEEAADHSVRMYSGPNPDQVCYPPGTVGQYAFGRVHFVPTVRPAMAPSVDDADEATKNVIPTATTDTGRVGFVSSDVRDTNNPEWLFRMSEHRILALGGLVALPAEMGYVTGISTFRNASTGVGTGPLVVFARDGVSAFDVSVPRAGWRPAPNSSEKSAGFGQVLFFGTGTRSPFSISQVNDDLLFLDNDGQLRTIRYTVSKTAGSSGALSNTPISTEVTPFIEASDKAYLPYASLSFAFNRVLFTTTGAEGPYFKGLISLDLDPTFGVSGQSNALFDGVWTGFRFLRCLSVRHRDAMRHLIVALQGSTSYLLWYEDGAITDPNGTRVEAQLWTRVFQFQGFELATKILDFVDVWVSDIKTRLDFEVLFRPATYPNWVSLGTKQLNVLGAVPQYRRRLRFSVVPDQIGCHPVTQEQLNVASGFQIALRWTGQATISGMQLAATAVPDAPPDPCAEDNPEDATMEAAPGVSLDDFSYEVTL